MHPIKNFEGSKDAVFLPDKIDKEEDNITRVVKRSETEQHGSGGIEF